MRSRRAIPVGLAVLAYAIAILQRPGELVADTKVNLYVDPSRFLSDVASLWSPTTDLGHVWAGQYGGYLWPMAPWFALGDALGIPAWLVHRLWLGTLLALAAWGVVRLLDALADRPRGPLHLAAGALYVVNPYVTVYAGRQSVALLAYASLPWLLLAVHRGLREPRSWRWPALFALVLTSAGGGVNAGLTGWVLVGPLLLVVYDLVWGGVARAALGPFLVRLVPVAVVVNLWWVLPLLLTARAAPNFLPFTEQAGTIWSTTSLSESLRLMGFWTSYVGTGFGGVLTPYQSSATAMLGFAPVLLASLLVPAVALATFPWTRGWRYAPFFLLLTFAGLVIMAAGFPEGTPLRRAATGVYYRVDTVQVLRTTYKAGALTALGLAALGGAAFALGWARWRGAARVALAAGAAVLVALASWPLVSGRAVERQLAIDVPPAYERLAADLGRRSDATRTLQLPGQLFAIARWGGTWDPVLPALTDHPVTTRWIVPFSDLRSADLQFAVDSLVTQERLRPGQLLPLLDLLGVGNVVVAADGDRARGGELPEGDLPRVLGELRGGRSYGDRLAVRPAADDIAPVLRLPRLRDVPVGGGGAIVRVLPRSPMTVVDGASGGVTALAAFGALRPDRPLAYAPDLGADGVRAAAREGAAFVVADGNRRRAFVAARPRGQTGPTLPASRGVSADGNILDPFGDLDTAVQTVAIYGGGISDVQAPASPQVTQLPDRRPFAALDGDPSTAWLADRVLDRPRHRITVTFRRARDVDAIDLLPYSDARGRVQEVEIAGRTFRVRQGWNHLRLGLRGVSSLTVRLSKVTKPPPGVSKSAGGLRELRIPGVAATETLRPPTRVEDALRGERLDRSSLTYLLERTTADVPDRRRRYVGDLGAGLLRDARDPEARIARLVSPPAARRYGVDAWASVAPTVGDDVVDRLAGVPLRGARFVSSSRFDGAGRFRASSAFDGDPRSAWVGEWVGRAPAWLGWRAPRPVAVRRLTLTRPPFLVRTPTRVALTVDGVRRAVVAVGGDGRVSLPAPVRGRSFRLDVLDARFPAGTPAWVRQRRGVGIGEVRGAGVRAAVPRTGTVRVPCGAATFGGVPLGGVVSHADLDAGRPLRVRGCRPLSLPAGPVPLSGSVAPLRVDAARLDSPAPAGLPAPVGGGRVLDAGDLGNGRRDGARVDVTGPSWLILGESYDRFWKATCDGRDLGEPRPMQGFANGWPLDRGCRTLDFRYTPQRLATAGYVVSAVAIALLLALLAAGAWRTRRSRHTSRAGGSPQPRLARTERPGEGVAPGPEDAAADGEGAAAGGEGAVAGGEGAVAGGEGAVAGGEGAGAGVPPARALTPRRALAVAAIAALGIGFGFGLRAGVVALPVLAVVLWRGVSDRVLGLAAGVALAVVVPAIYVVVALTNDDENFRGGDLTAYAIDRIAAHWVALAALVALGVVLVRTLADLRGARVRRR